MATTAKPGRAHDVEVVWAMPAPAPRLARGTISGPAQPGAIPSITDLTNLARGIATEINFERAALRLQRDAARLANAVEAVCVVFDWPRRAAWTVRGAINNESVKELVAEVAGSGRRSVVGNALLQPIGPAPARAVLALRKPPGATFTIAEISMISVLTDGLASSINRLVTR